MSKLVSYKEDVLAVETVVVVPLTMPPLVVGFTAGLADAVAMGVGSGVGRSGRGINGDVGAGVGVG